MINKQKTATKIMTRKRPAKGSMKRLTLVVPEVHKVAKQAAEDIYEIYSLIYSMKKKTSYSLKHIIYITSQKWTFFYICVHLQVTKV